MFISSPQKRYKNINKNKKIFFKLGDPTMIDLTPTYFH